MHQHSSPTKSQSDCLSVCPDLIYVSTMVVMDTPSTTIKVDKAKIAILMPNLITFTYKMNYGNPYQHLLDPLYPNKHNWQYNANASQQDNSGCIPKALWEQLPHM